MPNFSFNFQEGRVLRGDIVKEMFSDYPDIVNVEQFMKMLQIGRVLAYRIIKEGAIKAVRIGRQYKIAKLDIIRYINDGGYYEG